MLLPHDYMNYWLTGKKITEVSNGRQGERQSTWTEMYVIIWVVLIHPLLPYMTLNVSAVALYWCAVLACASCRGCMAFTQGLHGLCHVGPSMTCNGSPLPCKCQLWHCHIYAIQSARTGLEQHCLCSGCVTWLLDCQSEPYRLHLPAQCERNGWGEGRLPLPAAASVCWHGRDMPCISCIHACVCGQSATLAGGLDRLGL